MGIKNVIQKSDATLGKINPRYDLTCENMREIRDTYGGSFDVICCSFRFGYLQGMKAAKAEMKKETAAQ